MNETSKEKESIGIALLKRKINFMGLQKICLGLFYKDQDLKKIIVRMSASEIRKILNTNSGSFYSRLASLDNANNHIMINDKGEFYPIPVKTNVIYENGDMKLLYPEEIEDLLPTIKQVFCVLDLNTILYFKSPYALRLYEMLKSIELTETNNKRQKELTFCFERQLSRLKLDLGIISIEDPLINKALTENKYPDYDTIVQTYESIKRQQAMEVVKTLSNSLKNTNLPNIEQSRLINIEKKKLFPSYNEWRVFKSELLESVIEEINNAPHNISVSYELCKSGRGGKVTGLRFHVIIKNQNIIKKPSEKTTIALVHKTIEEPKNDNIIIPNFKKIEHQNEKQINVKNDFETKSLNTTNNIATKKRTNRRAFFFN